MIKSKLETDRMTNQQVVDKLSLVATNMAKPAALLVFTAPEPILTVLSGHATTMGQMMNDRASMQMQVRQMTMAIRDERTLATADLAAEAEYVDTKANGDPAKITLAGLDVADQPSPVGPMPQVENLHAAAGDASSEIDLNWDPILHGLTNYRVEMTTDPAGLTGWAFKMNAGRKSKATVTGLTSGTRYWFRIIAEGAGPEGAPSDPATKMAP